MAPSIRSALDREVAKLIRRHNTACRTEVRERKRYTKRSGNQATSPKATTPLHWTAHPHFNPYYVRSRSTKIGRSIAAKVKAGTYMPSPILRSGIPKSGGGTREISILTIPDAAVSYSLGTRLIERNAHFFTSYTYAYRTDRNAHHAIQHLMSEIRGCNRLFVVEYDFSRYFDSIRHSYLDAILKRNFLISVEERKLVSRLLRVRYANGVHDYNNGVFTGTQRGIPQGSTLSLFLANVACHELDRLIEREGAVFARYADDTLIVCDSYEKADRCARHILDHGKTAGTEVNFQKSEGISVLTKHGDAEMKSKSSVTFLAHSLSSKGVGVSPRSVKRLKRRVAQIIQQHLLLQPTRGQVDPDRLGRGFTDWDLVTCVNEIRRYLYGRISEDDLRVSLRGQARFNITRCALSFYPTVDESEADVFKTLDGWLVDTLTRAYKKRVKLLARLGIHTVELRPDEVKSGTWYDFPSIQNDARLPSFYLSWQYVHRCAQLYGLSKFPSPTYGYV